MIVASTCPAMQVGDGVFKHAASSAIRAYKHYVSPYLDAHCKYTPSCSLYTQDAIQDYGVMKGSAMGLLRILRCNQYAAGGSDPVPVPQGKPLPQIPYATWVHPSTPVAVHSSRTARFAAAAVGLLTGVAGAAVAGVMGSVVFAATGGVVGAFAGTHHLDRLNARVSTEFGEASVMGAAVLERPLGMAGHKTYTAVESLLGSAAASGVGGAIGVLTGTLVGTIGGAFKAAAAGWRVFSLMGQHYTLQHLHAEAPAV